MADAPTDGADDRTDASATGPPAPDFFGRPASGPASNPTTTRRTAAAAQPPLWQDHGIRAWAIGLPFGLLLAFAPWWFLRLFSWFWGALMHEIGHATVAWISGRPAIPAIKLTGHAAAVHQAQILPLALLLLAGTAWWTWTVRRHRLWRWIAGAVLILHLALVFWEIFFDLTMLYAGIGGELVFAGVFLWRAFTGGFTEASYERPVYAVLGWGAVFDNLGLALGLIFSAAARHHYLHHGSFGLQNDLVRIANDVLGISLQAAAVPVVFAALAVPVVVWWLGRLWQREMGT